MRAYVTLTAAPQTAPRVGAALAATRLPGGARVLAAFAPTIGLSANTVPVLLGGPEGALDAAVASLGGLDGVRSAEAVALTPVAERNPDLLAAGPVMFTNRWFHVFDAQAAAFEEDTLLAWDGFETGTGCKVVGLWKAAPEDGVTAYLLIARYADLAAWASSRYFWLEGERPDWAVRFERRRGTMADTSVSANRFVTAGPD